MAGSTRLRAFKALLGETVGLAAINPAVSGGAGGPSWVLSVLYHPSDHDVGQVQRSWGAAAAFTIAMLKLTSWGKTPWLRLLVNIGSGTVVVSGCSGGQRTRSMS